MAPAKRNNGAEQSFDTAESPVEDRGSNVTAARNTIFVEPLVQSLRPNRRRAQQACLVCRSRKVRCDVTENYPCGNCQWNKQECVIYSRRAGRPRASQQTRKNAASSPRHAVTSTTPSQKSSHDEEDTQSPQSSPAPCLPTTAEASETRSALQLPLDLECSELEMNFTPDAYEDKLFPFLFLPSFIRRTENKLGIDDLVFLQTKGAFTVPTGPLQDALVRAYLEHVHPLLPLVNLEDFMESITEGNEMNSQVSLLFFQAVMFAGSAYVEMDLLRDAGYRTRKYARKAFYEKVRLLYDFNFEPDGLVVISALLLMTFWYAPSDDHKNTWHWMHVAISHAFSLDLHLDPKLMEPVPSLTVQRLRRRIWWCCFIRDRLISLSMRRHPRIRDDDYNVPKLELADFQSEHLHGKRPARTDSLCSYFDNRTRRVTLARLCVEQANLCRCLKYSVTPNMKILPDIIGSISNVSGMFPIDHRSFATCQRELLEWHDTLYHCDKYQPIMAADLHADGSANLELNRAVLHMLYYTGVLGLHHYRVSDPGIPPDEKELSKVFVQHSAKRISEITGNIKEHGLDRFLPITAITTTISAITVHLLEIRGVFHADVMDAQQNYQRCVMVMESMKEMYFSSDFSQATAGLSFPAVLLDDDVGLSLGSFDWGWENDTERSSFAVS